VVVFDGRVCTVARPSAKKSTLTVKSYKSSQVKSLTVARPAIGEEEHAHRQVIQVKSSQVKSRTVARPAIGEEEHAHLYMATIGDQRW
jgi:hypothetical protein